MFIGHYAIAFGAKAAAPRSSLGMLFVATAFIDLLWPVLVLFGVERVQIVPGITRVTPLDFVYYPYSHSLLAALLWGVALGALYGWRTGYRRGALVVGLLVISHWLADAIVHRPDLPLYPGSETLVGLGLWNSVAATLAVEGTLFVAGLGLYLRTTRPVDRIGRFALALLAALLLIIYAAGQFGPPPPSAAAIAWAGQLQWLFVLCAWWADSHRKSVSCRQF